MDTGIVNIWSSAYGPRRVELSELQDFCIPTRTGNPEMSADTTKRASNRKSIIYTYLQFVSHVTRVPILLQYSTL